MFPLKDGRFTFYKSFTARDGLTADFVHTILEDREGTIWVGGGMGLACFDGSRFRLIVPADGATFGGVSGIEETADGGLWLCGSRGVIHIAASEVRKFLEGPSHRVPYEVFDSLDGLPGTFQDIGPWSREIQGTDGRLWFVATKGERWQRLEVTMQEPLSNT